MFVKWDGTEETTAALARFPLEADEAAIALLFTGDIVHDRLDTETDTTIEETDDVTIGEEAAHGHGRQLHMIDAEKSTMIMDMRRRSDVLIERKRRS